MGVTSALCATKTGACSTAKPMLYSQLFGENMDTMAFQGHHKVKRASSHTDAASLTTSTSQIRHAMDRCSKMERLTDRSGRGISSTSMPGFAFFPQPIALVAATAAELWSFRAVTKDSYEISV